MTDAATIAAENDDFRQHPSKGVLILTDGIRCNSAKDIAKIIAKVRNFKRFTKGNDPYGEHDFGSFIFKGHKIFWKIDTYDTRFLYISPYISGVRLAHKVLTIMYAEDY